MCYTNQEKPIEELILNAKCKSSADHEKQIKIVEAVNEMKADSARLGATTVWVYSSGGYRFGFNVTSQTICTIEEYNQCIEEMKYHYDIPRWCSYSRADKELLTVENSDYSFYWQETLTIEGVDYSFYETEEFAYGQIVYVDDAKFSGESIKFGCLTLNGNNAILLTDVGYMSYPLTGISSKPIKSKEDIEQEEAKKKQMKALMKKHSSKFCRPEQFESVINDMQGGGELAEIILPLEES